MISIKEPDEAQQPILDKGVRRHLGLELRVMYQKEAPILPSDEIDYRIERMEANETVILEIRDTILSRLGSTKENPFVESCPVFTALAQLIRANRVAAYQIMSYALLEFGYEMDRWGGWPEVDGVQNGAAARRIWYKFAHAGLPKNEEAWQESLMTVGAFVYALMVRNERNPAFWDKLSGIAHDRFRRAIDVYRRSL